MINADNMFVRVYFGVRLVFVKVFGSIVEETLNILIYMDNQFLFYR